MAPPKKRKTDRSESITAQAESTSAQTEADVIEKPFQPELSGADFLASPIVASLLKRDLSTWSEDEIMKLARFLSNRLGVDLRNDEAEVQYKVQKFAEKIDSLSFNHEKFQRVADPILMHLSIPGAWPPPNYLQVLNQINILQGGAANAGPAGQPISFVRNHNHYLEINNSETYERLVGALKVSFNQIEIIRTNPSIVITL
eukprot:TRINITY_DN20978_c0_g1::TRINITY_DN20978_c0_g1_i1::g.9459::m.9459 TRINITY_DN20978_c0_g1::TRINITY_DN20978_c0_g1_i1::g.9459  ORF type:complete len:201 (+),score=9.70,SAS4/PF15460.1/0.06 TRINITY_DN20978_c0_g1_i1:3-605(+)